MVKCPECGSPIHVHSRCWVCHRCGAEGCGLAGLEVVSDDQAQSGGSTDTPRGLEAKDVSVPSRVLDCRSGEKQRGAAWPPMK